MTQTDKAALSSLMAFALSWSISVGMASVEEGGLVFEVTSTSVDVDEKTDGDLSWNPPADEVAREFTTEMETNIQRAITNVEDRLMNALANQHRLFLPAKGSFLMKDPIFNSKGDLMVKLAYNGADPPKPPPKK
ncbi:hypothetical protein LCI18_000336 [Fusarium solani-melongenae]|uniref:Uncharacterized protein n=1 Tax=Fusarium solani subsp. cucurbitae TaxID=2747967 RepID=A0ACD3YKL1_FUSSC|nr:hypothetical protein LCI18_000336 [Fusarium solani-melongenae]